MPNCYQSKSNVFQSFGGVTVALQSVKIKQFARNIFGTVVHFLQSLNQILAIFAHILGKQKARQTVELIIVIKALCWFR